MGKWHSRAVRRATAEGPRRPALRHNRNYRLLWVGQVLSQLGSEFGVLAYPLLVLALTHSAIIAGAVGTVSALIAFVVRLPAGALADRIDRRRAMIFCDLTRAGVLAALAAGVALDAVSWPVVLAAAVVDRAGDTLFTPASTALIPAIVEDDQLEAAWAGVEARQFAAGLGGPALGGLLYGIGRAVPFVGDAVSYGISVVTSGAIRGDFAAEQAERDGLWREAFAGIRFIWGDPLLRAVVTEAPVINFAFSGMLYTLVIGLRVNGVSATVIGLTQAAVALSGLLGAVLAPRLQPKVTIYGLALALTAGGSLFVAGAAFLMPSPLAVIPLAVPVVLSPVTNAALFATMLRRTPKEMQGRVNNSVIQLATGLAAVSPLLAGAVVEAVSASWAMGTFGAALVLSAVLVVGLPGLRRASRAAALETSPVAAEA